MLTKEYRIPMPFDVEEYRIAQLYMIAKKSELESEGSNSGVEILKNEPYDDGPGGSGQYTNKLYYIGAHLPYWLRGFLPKSLSSIKEEAWNAYPYSKNKIFTPHMSKFSLEIESKYLDGGPRLQNAFGLTEEELGSRVVDVVDFVSEKISGADYNQADDPSVYKSEKTERGPLADDWLEKTEASIAGKCFGYSNCGDTTTTNSNSKKTDLMCVYKICRVRFDQWPIQTRVEQFIHDYIRKMLIVSHRQAWAWQDEWHGLTMTDIREMERQTQERLSKMMKTDSSK